MIWLLIASFCLSPIPYAATARVELRAYVKAEETQEERLFEYLESMLDISERKIHSAGRNTDALESAKKLLEDLSFTIKQIDTPHIMNGFRERFNLIEIEHARQLNYINSILNAERIKRQLLGQSA